ncbi:tryptophan N-monooxygenase CYP79A68-like [Zingiber officinale]|uniref:tryptophan N-monooxygenase CYP79A68-like n=1 Tax=Zingiber officinale TaxID=94328 RepID=UPI001C4B137B|nr:tryptophan N-monooxygenase CYP79A68-like [Zingiber officinale]
MFFSLTLSIRPQPHGTATTTGLLGAAVALLLAACLFSILRKRDKRLPPGPTPWPLVGSLIPLLRHRPHFRWVMAEADGEDITCIRLGSAHVVVVNSPELACEFLKRHDANFASRPLTVATKHSSRNFLSVIFSPLGPQWKKMRRVIASEVLSSARLRWLAAARAEEADHLTRYLRNLCLAGGGGVRMMFGVRHFGAGGPHQGPGEEEVEHVEAAFSMLSVLYAFCPSDFLPWLRCLDLEGHERIAEQAASTICKYHDPIIDERIEKWRSGEKKEVEDLLDVMISLADDSGKPMLSTEEIKAQCAEFMYATVDNPSNTAEWLLAHLLEQTDIMRKAVEELDRVVGKEQLVVESDFARLPYVKACARQALRLHPVAPFNPPHVAINDAIVSNYFIPNGSMVLLGRAVLGRNPKVWDDPTQFNPSRHLMNGHQEVELAEPSLRMISFTTGRRQCMGAQLGTAMTYMLVGRVLQAFEWSLPIDETGIDLSEERMRLFKAKPLMSCAKIRLPDLLENL